MAFSHAFAASSNPSIAPNKIPQFTKKKSTNIITIPTANKWSIDQDHILLSTPSRNYNHSSGHHNFSDEFHMEHARKLKEVRLAFTQVREDPLEDLIMVDTVQRLGIDYHFQDEINAIMQRQYMKSTGARDLQDHMLYEVALRFRLLRQGGFYASSDVFNCFMNKDGKFKQELSKDITGLVELFEASHLSTEGEETLDEAEDFSNQLLGVWATNLNHRQAGIIGNTLRSPCHKSLARFRAKNFLTSFQGTSQLDNVLQQLAKMDFNMVQSIHQKEMLQISQWWRDLGLAKEMKFVRDQPLKWYMWPMAILTDPNLSELRVETTKPISLIYAIDDVYDVYGKLDELTLFTEAVNRWDFAIVEQLPDCFKACFNALNDVTTEIAQKVHKEHGWNPLDSLRKTWATLCNAFLVEARWFANGHLPKAEDYLKNGIVSSGVHVLLIHMFFLLGEGITQESVDVVDNGNAGIIKSTATILRLWDDLGSAEDENQDGQDGSYLKCYIKENQGSSVESARQHVNRMINDSWKHLNRHCLSPYPFSASMVKGSLNVARMVPLMYGYDDSHCLPGLENHMKSLIYESFSL